MPPDERVTLTSIRFIEFKALREFSISLRGMTVLVGPNNSGKSTVISSLRVLGAALRTARSKNPTRFDIGDRDVVGYQVPRESIPISLENVHSDLADSDARVSFRFSNGNRLDLLFPADGGCYLVPDPAGRRIANTADFKRAYPFEVVIVPVLGPVEHDEEIVDASTVRWNLATHRASRNFRNYWRHYPAGFEQFASLLSATWPDVEITQPQIGLSASGATLYMMCEEGRKPRELFWMGVGFQIWCQLLTHICRGEGAQLFVVDEPEIYLHPNLQRQLVSLLRQSTTDVLIATHSSDIVTEAEPTEIITIDKRQRSGRRLKSGADVAEALRYIGSAQNLVFTQLARTRKLLFVEGDEYAIIAAFARLLGQTRVAAGLDYAVTSAGGFPTYDGITTTCRGVAEALGQEIRFAGVFDRDYRCDEEVAEVGSRLHQRLDLLHIQRRKETENYLLIPSVLDRALNGAIKDRARRTGRPSPEAVVDASALLDVVTAPMRPDVYGQYFGKRSDYLRRRGIDSSSVAADLMAWFDPAWSNLDERLEIVPGKEVLHRLNRLCQERFHVAIGWRAVVGAFHQSEIPLEMRSLIQALGRFGSAQGPVTPQETP